MLFSRRLLLAFKLETSVRVQAVNQLIFAIHFFRNVGWKNIMENYLHINNYGICYDEVMVSVINDDDEVLRVLWYELCHRMQIHEERRATR